MSALHRLSASDLTALAAALQSGRLDPPFAGIGRYLEEPEATTVRAELAEIGAVGAGPPVLAMFLERLAAARADLETSLLDLVCSGPDTPGVPSRDTAVVVRELFAAAKTSVMVAGFAIAQGRAVFRVLAEQMALMPALEVRLHLDIRRAYRDRTTRSEALVAEFAHRFRTREWPAKAADGRLPEVYYDPRSLDPDQTKRSALHAKCVVIDRKVAFVSSANFTEAAALRNIEVGVLVRSGALARRLDGHFAALVASGVLLRVPGL